MSPGPDYVQIVRDRLAEIGRLPTPSHTVLVEGPNGLDGWPLYVCREVRRIPRFNTTEYVYRLAQTCPDDVYDDFHDTVIEARNPVDQMAARQFAQRMRTVHAWLGNQPADPDRLFALARFHDTGETGR